MKQYKLLSTLLLFISFATATVYENGEDGSSSSWKVVDNNPSGAVVSNIFDSQKNSNVIEFEGEGRKNAYMLGHSKNSKGWKNHNEKSMKLQLQFTDKYQIYVYIKTKRGNRILSYDYKNEDKGRKGKYIKIGLGSNTRSSKWITIQRNLEKDLQKYEPSNYIKYVNGIKIKGSGRIDDIELITSEEDNVSTHPLILSHIKTKRVKKNSAKISWKTNHKATTQIEYGLTTDYGDFSKKKKKYRKHHRIKLRHLEPATTYHYRAISKDKNGNTTVSQDKSFTTIGKVTDEFHSEDAFISRWNMVKQPDGKINFIIQTDNNFDYNFNIDWGDETQDIGVRDEIEHQYTHEGNYTISIVGQYPKIVHPCLYTLDRHRHYIYHLLSIHQWGTQQWKSMSGAFKICREFNEIIDNNAPDLSNVTDMQAMFVGASQFNQPLNHWDVSNVTKMNNMFSYSDFNQPLDHWDVSNVTTMDNMFMSAYKFNQKLNDWDVSNVRDMGMMFYQAKKFNQSLNSWNVSNVTSMYAMFSGTSNFNQNLNNWDTSNVTRMTSIFEESAQDPLPSWYK